MKLQLRIKNNRLSLISDPLDGQSFYLLPCIWLIAELFIEEVSHPGPGVPSNTASFRCNP